MGVDRQALLEAYRRLETPLYNVLYRMLWNPADCKDIAHDAFLRVWAMRDRVRADDIDALVYATAINLARNRVRWLRLRKWTGSDAMDAQAAPDDPCDALERAQLRAVLMSMPRIAREVLLSEFAGLSGPEIARVLAIPEGTVASRRHHALRQLRMRMGGHDGGQ